MLLGEFVFFFFFFLIFIFQAIKITNFRIQIIKADDGFGTVCKVDAGYYSQGFLLFVHFKSFKFEFNFPFKIKRGLCDI